MRTTSTVLLAVSACLTPATAHAQNLEVLRTTPDVPQAHRITYDPVRDALLTRGGISGLGTIDTRLLDRGTWLWEPAGAAHEPDAVWQFGMVTDSVRNRVVLFGGSAIPRDWTTLDQTWEWDGMDWRLVNTAHSPAPRRVDAMAFDAGRGRTVLFGGFGTGFQDPLGDTWEYAGLTWTRRQPAHSPPAGPGRMAYDAARAVTVLLAVGGTWEWDGNDWRGPLAAETTDLDDVLLWDGGRGRVLRITDRGDVASWDGTTWTPFRNPQVQRFPIRFGFDPTPAGGVLLTDDAAELQRFTGSDWQPVGPDLRPLPGLHDLEWDAAANRLLSAAGDGSVFARDSLTGKWQRIHPSALPTSLNGGVWALDTARDQIVLHGVERAGFSGRTFVFDLGARQWSEAHPTHPGPSTWGAAAAFDRRRQRLVVWGGEGGGPTQPPVWEWDGQDWQRIDRPFTPNIRAWGAQMVYDPDREVVTLFGGGNFAVPYLTSTWEWDGRRWSLREAQNPLLDQRSIRSATYHTARRRIVALAQNATGIDDQFLEWDGDAGTWNQINGLGAPLRPGLGEILGYDPVHRELVVAAANDLGWVVRSTEPAESSPFGTGCPGSSGRTPRLASSPTRLPWLGDRLSLKVDRLAPGVRIAALLLGFSDRTWNGTPLPADLTPIGLTNCSLYVSTEVAETLLASSGQAGWDLNLPADPHLLGDVLFVQAGSFDRAANLGGFALSNAVRLQAGAR